MDPLAARLAGLTLLTKLRRPILLSWLQGSPARSRHVRALAMCDGHLSVSDGIAGFVRSRWNAPVITVGNPVDLDVAACPRPSPGEPHRFVYVGRLASEKRVDRILDALAHVGGDWRLHVVGDGPEREGLRRRAAQLGISNRVVWSGWLADPWSSLHAASALLLTSDHEGLPMVLLEAAARGIPLIAMDCEYGPRDVVIHANGHLLALGDVSGLSTLLQNITMGKLCLPGQEQVRETVRRYSMPAYIDAFEMALDCFRGQRQR